MTVKEPTSIEQYVTKDGRLTLAGLLLLQQMVLAIRDNESRLTAGGL